MILLLAFHQEALSQKPIEVLLLGTFHFDNPGLDVAQFDNANVLTAIRQFEILDLVKKLRTFHPDKIYIESLPESQNSIDSLVDQYKKGKYNLKANEINQLGFRLAKELNLTTLRCIDYRNADFPFDSLMKSAGAAKQTDLIRFIQRTIDSIQNSFNAALKNKTIGQILLDYNSTQSIHEGIDFYFKLLPAGQEGNHVGSYLVSEWWRRNMIIYENILKSLSGKEKRILVLFGASHTALLNEMMKFNPDFKIISVGQVLK